jgi:hypothetical protein
MIATNRQSLFWGVNFAAAYMLSKHLGNLEGRQLMASTVSLTIASAIYNEKIVV